MMKIEKIVLLLLLFLAFTGCGSKIDKAHEKIKQLLEKNYEYTCDNNICSKEVLEDEKITNIYYDFDRAVTGYEMLEETTTFTSKTVLDYKYKTGNVNYSFVIKFDNGEEYVTTAILDKNNEYSCNSLVDCDNLKTILVSAKTNFEDILSEALVKIEDIK